MRIRESVAAKIVLVLVAAAIAAAIAAVLAPKSSAIPPFPGTCVSGGGGFIGYGGYEDCDLWPDGSFWHREFGGGPFAFGGRSGRVCDGFPPPFTDNDPTTPCPGVVMP